MTTEEEDVEKCDVCGAEAVDYDYDGYPFCAAHLDAERPGQPRPRDKGEAAYLRHMHAVNKGRNG